jgi:molybdate transport system substrate-binding protein
VAITASRSIVRAPVVLVFLIFIASALAGNRGPTPTLAQESIACPEPAAQATAAAEATPVADTAPAEFPAEGGDITVFAAASLTASFERIKAELEAAQPDLTITYNFAGSQALVTQLSEGAEADVFAAASRAQMTNAFDAGAIIGEPEVFTGNRLTIVVPADNPAGIQSAADLANEGLDLVLAAPEVPVGQYARESACKMAADTATYGEGFLDAVAGNIVSNEDNVKAVLTKVRLGEAEAGIVYTTDITPDVAADVLQIEIPADVNVIATYPIAPVEGGDAALADAFIDYVLGPDGQATLVEFGFEPAP